MSYKVFLVEDEIVTREGIRDNVDWQAQGFELCGEAPDGEIALPQLQAIRPDVLITDIKMPFIDGLQLAKIVHERLPSTRIVILSGHDEFDYAQQAIKLGVTEYLLKPVTVQQLQQVLHGLASQLDLERGEERALAQLRQQVEESRAALAEKLWFKLLVNAISLPDAIEQSEQLHLDLIARCYLVVVIRFVAESTATGLDYAECQRAQDVVFDIVGHDPDVSLLRKDLEELVLIIKGNTSEYLLEARDLILEQIQSQLRQTGCQMLVGRGTPIARMTEIGASFIGALAEVEDAARSQRGELVVGANAADWLKVDRSALEDYLTCGVQEELDGFFDGFVLPLSRARQSSIVNSYILLDIVFTTARLVRDWGGDPDELIPELNRLETVLANVNTIGQVKQHVQPILARAIAFRDGQANGLHTGVIHQAREYIDHHYMDPEISLHAVASQVGHGPSHFSTIFSEATGQTFKEYLTEVRIRRARELLRTTSLRSTEISDQVGYKDAHYFGLVFRKSTGLSPREFRAQPHRPRVENN
jgi:two-component system response regulator YesN